MKQVIRALSILCCAALVAACPPPAAQEGDRAAIDQLRSDYIAAYEAGDLDGILALWAEEAVWIAQDEEPLRGKEAISSAYDDPTFGNAEFTITPEETRVAANWAAEWGTYSLAWTDADGATQTIEGRYAALDKQEADGTWKIARLNTSFATPAGEAQTYAQAASTDVAFENDRIIVQRIQFEPGSWVGEHSHAGNQLAVALDGVTTTFREGGEESQQSLAPGEVLWLEATNAHDHKTDPAGELLLITLK